MLVSTRWLISRLPYPVYKLFTAAFIVIGRPFLHKKKRLAMENLQAAFGHEKTAEEIKAIADKAFDNFGLGMIELIYFLDRPRDVMAKVTFEGKEHLDEALKKGKGAVLLSAHFGNFILMFIRMALEGYKTNCIMRRMRDENFEEYISAFRNANGIHTIYAWPRRDCVQTSLQRLKENQTLFILLDQNFGDDGRVFVDFFGQPAATATGPVIFSLRSGAPILPVFIRRDGKNFKIIIDPPVALERSGESEEDLVRNVSRLSKVIEGYIRRYPEEWGGWMHRRWKSKRVSTD